MDETGFTPKTESVGGSGPQYLPFVAFAAIWFCAVLFLASKGEWAWVGRAVGIAGGMGLLILPTVWLTREQTGDSGHGEDQRSSVDKTSLEETRARLWLQLICVLSLAVLASLRFTEILGWSWFVDLLYEVGNDLPIPNANYLANPVLYVILPGIVALGLGARWREVGFRGGWRTWRVVGVWMLPVVGVWIYGMAKTDLGVGRVVRVLISNTFQNGFMEEFLWRGLVQTRIARLWTPGWGLVLASLLFGWWHIDAVTGWAGTDWWLAGALNVVVQAPTGLALGIIFDRTRNLLAPSVVHAVLNAVEV